MKNLFYTLCFIFLMASPAFSALSTADINTINLKNDSLYLLDIGDITKDIIVSDENIVKVIPFITLSENGEKVFIETNSDGVCDVLIKTQSNDYKIRFITGKVFQDEKQGLIQIDMPSNLAGKM